MLDPRQVRHGAVWQYLGESEDEGEGKEEMWSSDVVVYRR